MSEKKAIPKVLLGVAVLFFVATAAPVMADVPGTWNGYVTINDTLAGDNVIVSAHVNGVATPTLQCSVRCGVADAGGYNLNVEASAGDTVTFKVFGVTTAQGAQTWGPGAHDLLNLSINTSQIGIECNYSQACASDNCAEDYDAVGAWCVPSGSCSNNNVTTPNGGAVCDGSNRQYCSNGTWSSTACGSGCSSGVCISGGESSDAGSSAGAPSAAPAAPSEGEAEVTPPPIESEVVEDVEVGEAKTGEETVIEIPLTGTLVVEELEVVTNKNIVDVSVTVTQQVSTPGDAKAPSLPKGGTVYGYVRVQTKNMESADMDSAKISFKMENAWLEENDMDIDTVAMNRYDPKTQDWIKLPTTQVKTTSKYAYFEAESDHLSLFSITVEQKEEAEEVPEEEEEEVKEVEEEPVIAPKEIIPEEKKIPNWAYAAIVVLILALVGFGYWHMKQGEVPAKGKGKKK